MRDQRAERNAAAEPFGEHHDVRRDARVLESEELAGAADPGLDLVEDQQDAVLGRQSAQAAQELVRRDEHAGLALDRLQHHGDGASA